MADRPVSLKDVAERAGVSTTTVSHVINQTRFVKPETISKVEKAIEELNYIHNSVARALRSKKSNVIGVMINGFNNHFFLDILRGIEDVLTKNGYNMILGNAGGKMQNQSQQLNIFGSWCVDGIITYGQGYLSMKGKYHAVGCPIVCLESPGNESTDNVLTDERKVTKHAVIELIKSGHRKIACITGTVEAYTSMERLAGYKEALEEEGIPLQNNLIRCGDSIVEGGYQKTLELLKETDATAIFVGNNLMTLGCIKALTERKIAIPSQMAVIGYDDDTWREVVATPISSIKQPLYEMGAEAAALLIKRIKEPDTPYQNIVIQPELIIRSSY